MALLSLTRNNMANETKLQNLQNNVNTVMNNVSRNTITNPNNELERNPENDTVEINANDATKDLAKKALKGSAALYLAGFAFGFAPGLFMLAAGAFLFSNKGESFRDKLANEIASDVNALKKFTELQNAKNQPVQQAQENVQPVAQNDVQSVSNTENQPQNKISTVQQSEKNEQTKNNIEQSNTAATNPINQEKVDDKQKCKMALKVLQNLTSQKANAERNHSSQANIDKIQSEINKLNAHIKDNFAPATIRSAKAILNFEAQRLERSYETLIKG